MSAAKWEAKEEPKDTLELEPAETGRTPSMAARGLDGAEERVSEPEDIAIETPKTGREEKKTTKKKPHQNTQVGGTTTEVCDGREDQGGEQEQRNHVKR